MALIKCKECGEEISKKADACPKCGAPRKQKTRPLAWFVLIILVVLFFIGLISSDSERIINPQLTPDEIKSQALSNVTYDDLFRNNENYVGKIVHYRGEITQVQNNYGDTYTLRISVTRREFGFWTDVIYASYEGSRILEDDIVEFWGLVKGIKDYTAVLGNEISVPEVDILLLENQNQ